MLATSMLWFRYQDNSILKELTLDFSAHAVTGLAGANGCEKSTLFMNLDGLLHPQQGMVVWQGKPLDYSKRGLLALRQQVATVFRDSDQQIFYTDINSDITLSLRNLGVDEAKITWRVEGALTLVDTRHFRHQPIQCLNHERKKHVAVIGALVLQAQYLLLDEPTADLDPSGHTQMIEIIKRVVAQRNHVVVSSHDIDLICEVSDAMYVLRRGEVLAHGTLGDVFARTDLIGQAGLIRPWLVELHTELDFPLCKAGTKFFSCTRENVLKEAL